MEGGVVAAVAASVAAVAATVGLVYATSAARASRQAAESARRTVEVAELSRRSAERARLRQRVERVGELVEAVYLGAQSEPRAVTVSPWTLGQLTVLRQAMVGLRRVLPKTTALRGTASPLELAERARTAQAEIDAVLANLARSRPAPRARRAPGGSGSRRGR